MLTHTRESHSLTPSTPVHSRTFFLTTHSDLLQWRGRVTPQLAYTLVKHHNNTQLGEHKSDALFSPI